MRINQESKTLDIEARDINYILPAYVRSYLFYSKNEMPLKIIFPMFPSVKVGSAEIPIEYVPPLEAVAVEIAEDGKSVAEVTPAQEAALDEKDEEMVRLKKELADATQTGRGGEEVGGTEKEETTSEQLLDESADLKLEEDTVEPKPESPAKKAFTVDPDPTHQPAPDRKPGQPPGGDIGTGQPLSDMHGRDRKDQSRTARDLLEEPDIEGTAEKPFEKEIKRDGNGKPIVEDRPSEDTQ